MRFAYADPPYLGLALKLYGHLHADAAEYDTPEAHKRLIDRLSGEYPDGWALSCHTPSLQIILPMCPSDVRVLSWVKTYCSFKPTVRLAYAWEPIILRGGRKRGRDKDIVRDWCACPIVPGAGFKGTKPEALCFWLFEVLGMEPEDEFVDIFPGSGAVTRAWEMWRSLPRLFNDYGSDVGQLALG